MDWQHLEAAADQVATLS